MQVLKHYISISILLLVIFSCSNDIGNVEKVEYPDITMKGTKYLLGRSDGDAVLFNADKMEIFFNRKKALIDGASFEQRKTETRELFVSGSADKADINTDTYLSNLTGNVKIFLHEDGNSIEAETVSWNKDTESITTTGNVYLDYGDIKINGTNLTGNLQTGVFTFSEIISGTITEKPKNETSESTILSEETTNKVQGNTTSENTSTVPNDIPPVISSNPESIEEEVAIE